jgi:hypothetical protein
MQEVQYMKLFTAAGAKLAFRLSLAVLALVGFALPVASRADSIILNKGGSITTNAMGGLTVQSGVVTIGTFSLDGLTSIGKIQIVTGGIVSGNLATGATLNPGTITITANATGQGLGLPALVFKGTFTGPLTWTRNVNANGTYTYALTGAVSGDYFIPGQAPAFGGTVQLSVNLKSPYSGRAGLSGGTTTLAGTPEPGSFGLLGAGLISAAGVVRRRMAGLSLLRRRPAA